MARSVSTHRNAVATVYLQLEDLDPEFGWTDFIEDLKVNVLHPKYPSLRGCDRWAGREDHVIAESETFEVSVSEYNGLVSVCLAPYDENNGLHVATARRMAAGFEKLIQAAFRDSALISQGRASNGEQFFTLANSPGSCVTSKEGRLW
jgi:hypothetical protein